MKSRAFFLVAALALVSSVAMVPGNARVLVVPEGQSFLIKKGDTVQITGRSEEPKLRSVRLLVDNKMVYEQQRSGPYSLQWLSRQASVGTHRVQVIGHCIDKDRLLSTVWAHVYDDDPAVIVSPTGEKPLVGEERVVLRVERAARVTGAKLFVDDFQLATSTSAEFPLDVNKVDSGEHKMRVVVETELGLAETPPITIRVGQRVTLSQSSVSNPIRLDLERTTTTVKPELPEGFKWQTLQVFCDHARVGEATAPNASVACDLSHMGAGRHKMTVVAMDASGLMYESNALDVVVERNMGVTSLPGATADPVASPPTASPLGRAIGQVKLSEPADLTFKTAAAADPAMASELPPLLLSAWKGALEEVRGRLNDDTRQLTDAANFGVLHYAVASRDLAVVQLVMKKGAPVHATSTDSMTPLHLAVIQGTKDIAVLLADSGVPVSTAWNGGPPDFKTPLMLAVAQRHSPMAAMLMQHGASPKQLDSNGWAPIHYAVLRSDQAMVKALVSQGADVNVRTARDGMRPIHYAVGLSDEHMVQVLVGMGADVNALGGTYTPLLMAVLASDVVVADVLLAARAQFEGADGQGRSLLYWATVGHDAPMVALLLRYGASPNVAEKAFHDTPLHVAAFWGDVATIKVLIAGGAKINVRNDVRLTPLGVALALKQYDAVALLRSHGAE